MSEHRIDEYIGALPLCSRMVRWTTPYFDESLWGLVIRSSDLNLYSDPRWLLEYAGINPSARGMRQLTTGRISFDSLWRFANLLNVHPRSIEGLMYRPFDTAPGQNTGYVVANRFNVYLADVTFSRSRVCPLCIEDSGYLRSAWDLTLVTVCPDHRVHLVDRCPACGRQLSWLRARVHECTCGFDLRKCSPIPVGIEDTYLSAWITSLRDDVKRQYGFLGERPFSEFDPGPFHQFLDFIWGLTRGSVCTGLSSLVRDKSTQEFHEWLMNALRSLPQWNDIFNEHLEFLWKRANALPYNPTLQNGFGYTYQVVFREFTDSGYDFLRDAFCEFIKTSWKGCIRSNSFAARGVAVSEVVPVAEAARMLGMRVSTIHRLVKLGRLSASSGRAGKRLYLLIERRSIDELLTLLNQTVDLGGAAALLTLGERTTVSLVRNGLLKAFSGPSIDGAAAWRFMDSEVRGLLARLEAQVVKVDWNSTTRCDFAHAVRVLAGVGCSVDEFVKVMVNGRITPFQVGGPFAFDRLQFSTTELTVLANEHALMKRGSMLTLPQVSELLGVKEESMYQWYRVGLLPKELVIAQGRKRVLVPAETIAWFRNAFFLPSKLARERGISSRRIIKILKDEGVLPLFGSNPECRQYIYDRAAVNKINLPYLLSTSRKYC